MTDFRPHNGQRGCIVKFKLLAPLLGIGVMLVFSCTTQIVFHERDIFMNPGVQNTTDTIGMSELTIHRPPGVRLDALYYRHPRGSDRFVILHLHGNAETIWSPGLFAYYRKAIDRGYDILSLEYAGYGKSSGISSVSGIEKDAAAAYRYLSREYPENRIVIWGRSLGTVPAMVLAAGHPESPLVLENIISTLSNLVKPIERSYSTIFRRIELVQGEKGSFNNIVEARNVRNPTIMVHGDEDPLALPVYAREVYRSLASNEKTFFWLRGEKHNYRSAAVFDTILERVQQFILFPPKPNPMTFAGQPSAH